MWLGDHFHKERLALMRDSGASCGICTVREDNLIQRLLLHKNGGHRSMPSSQTTQKQSSNLVKISDALLHCDEPLKHIHTDPIQGRWPPVSCQAVINGLLPEEPLTRQSSTSPSLTIITDEEQMDRTIPREE